MLRASCSVLVVVLVVLPVEHRSQLIKSISQQLQPNLDFLEHTLGLTRPQVTWGMHAVVRLATRWRYDLISIESGARASADVFCLPHGVAADLV